MNKELTHPFGRLDAHDIARALFVLQLLRHFGWRLRPRRRADCRLCQQGHRGHSTVSYTETVWHCHRCGAGGDVFALVMAELRCDFVKALQYAADLAGIKPAAPETRRQQRERRQREEQSRKNRLRVELAAASLQERERALRSWISGYLSFFERARCDAKARLQRNPNDDAAWECLATTEDIVRTLDAEARLLLFGSQRLRANYILHCHERQSIIARILNGNGVRDDHGHFMELSYV